MYDVTPLFAPLQVKRKTLRNRMVMPPMAVNRGLNTPEGREWYGRRAEGGVGLVIVEGTDVRSFGSGCTGESLRPLVEAIHRGGALAAIQLFPGVRDQPASPAELTIEEIEGLVAGYRVAAEICAEAGFDGVEPHGAHSYLLNQFFSPEKNRRADEYGGALAGRMRLALRVVEVMRPIASQAEMLILYRHTPVWLGYGIEESVSLGRELVAAGVYILDISPASDAAPGDRAAPFMALGVPVIAVNELDRLPRVLEVLCENRASLVAIGRGLIADPDWPTKVREGRLGEIIACTYCNRCFDDLGQGMAVGCSQWT